MQQDINLYLHLPKTPKLAITHNKMLAVSGIVIAILLLQSLFYFWQNYKLSALLQQENHQLQQRNEVLSKLLATYPSIDVRDIEKSTQKLQQELEIKKQIMKMISADGGFSTIFNALAEADVSGVWLTEINANNLNSTLELRGNASNTKLFQNFIHRMTNMEVFAKSKLELHELTKPGIDKPENPPYLSFYLVMKT